MPQVRILLGVFFYQRMGFRRGWSDEGKGCLDTHQFSTSSVPSLSGLFYSSSEIYLVGIILVCSIPGFSQNRPQLLTSLPHIFFDLSPNLSPIIYFFIIMSTSNQSKRLYFRSIDGLRLFAAANIVMFHLEQIGGFYDLKGFPWFFRIVKGPAFHATMFFILAGFIFYFLYENKMEAFSFKRFMMARLRLLYPLHAVTSMAMIPFVIMGLDGGDVSQAGKLACSCCVHFGLLFSLVPLGVYSLNTPSWALSAFFFCYLFFAPLMRLMGSIDKRRYAAGFLVACMIPLIVWSFVYAAIDFDKELYLFFHVFAPVRFFEFVAGMALARVYRLNRDRRSMVYSFVNNPWVNNCMIVGLLPLLFWSLGLRGRERPLLSWMSYHVFVVPIYAALIYLFACGRGFLAWIMRLRLVRMLGKCSFYPYLLHIPLISWLCWGLDRWFGYTSFLHSPLNCFLFVLFLYGGSALYAERFSKSRGLRNIGRTTPLSLEQRA
ncbi:MAG: acyltransferase family protein [Chitinivibrionales bacterium]|nr:acyltransferase family protein [Chitinivibrionales bacterium]